MSFGGGYIDVPERPGIGVEFDPQALAAVTDR